MSEILKGSFLTDKKGRKMEIVDAEARAKAEENAAAIGELSEGKAYQQYVTDGEGKAKWEDRLAYKDTVETIVLPEMTGVVANDGEYAQIDNITVESLTGSIAIGDTITVKWNNETYECVVRKDGSSYYAFGAEDGIVDSGDYPFYAYGRVDGTYFCINVNASVSSGTEITLSLTKKETTVKPIPAEYLPSTYDAIIAMPDGVTFPVAESDAAGVAFAVGSFGSLYTKAAAGIPINVIARYAYNYGGDYYEFLTPATYYVVMPNEDSNTREIHLEFKHPDKSGRQIVNISANGFEVFVMT